MRVTCLQENLARGLSVVGRAVTGRSTLPVLANVLLATDNSRLKLSATNLELGINCWIGARIEQDGAITVPARLLADLVNSLPPERIDMELDVRTQTLHLCCNRIETSIKGVDAQEFPIVSAADEGPVLRIAADTLRDMIRQVSIAAAGDESHPVLAGVLAELAPDRLTLVATDGHRLSVRMALLAGVEAGARAIIPVRALQELARISAEEEEPVRFSFSAARNQAFFHLSSIDLITQLVDGAFPDYQRIIPQGYRTRAVLSTGPFRSAAHLAMLFTRDANNVVRLRIEPAPGRIIVSATSAELGSNIAELEATVDGEPVEIAFNGRYLAEALGVIDTAEVALEVNTPTSPGLLSPIGGAPFRHVIGAMHTGH